ncbi:MAG TPA: hypothetical protein VFY91_01320 [Microbacterium sp.]|nr:hypothetical protein [Microbacterium sp.]
MDATLGSVESDVTEELERLRERAYGPDADIAEDAAAQARLTELESARRIVVGGSGSPAHRAGGPASFFDPAPTDHRAGHSDTTPVLRPGPASGTEAPSSPGSVTERVPGSPAPGRRDELAGGSSGPDAPPAPVEGYTPAAKPPWWRRRRSWAIVGAGALALAAVAVLIAWISPRPPDRVLALQSIGERDEFVDVYGNLEWLGLDAEGLRRYEDFRGFSVWSGVSRYGTDCLLVSRPEQGLGAVGCSPEGLPTIADLQKYMGVSDEAFDDMPTGSLIRFVLNGDRVDVYLGEADAIRTIGSSTERRSG